MTDGDDDGPDAPQDEARAPRGRLVALPPRAVRAATPENDDAPPEADADGPVRPAEDEETLRVRLELMRQEHRDMDHAIHALQAQGGDPFTIKRLKAQKLRLKDRIARIEDQITPDIIA